jgi:hypothetical protein
MQVFGSASLLHHFQPPQIDHIGDERTGYFLIVFTSDSAFLYISFPLIWINLHYSINRIYVNLLSS